MKSILAFTILAFSLVTHAETGLRPMLSHFATCSGTVTGMPVSFEFYEEFDGKTSQPTGKGVATQNLGGVMKLAGYTTVTNSETSRTIELFAVIEPDIRFAKIEVPKAGDSKVEVFAENFGSKWATLDCHADEMPF